MVCRIATGRVDCPCWRPQSRIACCQETSSPPKNSVSLSRSYPGKKTGRRDGVSPNRPTGLNWDAVNVLFQYYRACAASVPLVSFFRVSPNVVNKLLSRISKAVDASAQQNPSFSPFTVNKIGAAVCGNTRTFAVFDELNGYKHVLGGNLPVLIAPINGGAAGFFSSSLLRLPWRTRQASWRGKLGAVGCHCRESKKRSGGGGDGACPRRGVPQNHDFVRRVAYAGEATSTHVAHFLS